MENFKTNKKREELKKLSQEVKLTMLLNPEIKSINDGLKKMYAEKGHVVLKNMKQWNIEGFKVKKGEKAILLWAMKKKVTYLKEENNFEFFPICYLFSQKQVYKKKEA
jgi:hypothetical protein